MLFPSGRRNNAMPAFVEKILDPLELIALIATAIGFTLKVLYLKGADEVIMVSLSALSAVYFLNGFRILKKESPPGGSQQQMGFLELFATTIVNKAAWIGMAVVINGVLFGLLHLHGTAEMLLIGVPVLGISSLIMLIFVMANREKETGLNRTLTRAIPVFIIGLYLFMNTPV